MDPNSILTPAAFAALATGVGAPLWAGILMQFIDFLKTPIRWIDGREKLVAFILSAVLVVGAYVAALYSVPPAAQLTPFGILLLVLAWFNVGRLAMALHDDKSAKPGSLREPSAETIAAEMSTSPTVRAGGELPGGSPNPDDAAPAGVDESTIADDETLDAAQADAQPTGEGEGTT